MNERIRELAKQVAKEEGWGVEVWQTTFTENFAKLIVRECAMLVETLNPGYNDYRDQIENAFRRDCVDNIKQHFGVES